GVLRLYIDRPSTNLAAGFVWGEFEPKLLHAESNALAEARAKIDERERLLLELELPRQKIELSRRIEELQRQVTLMKILATNQTVASVALPFAGIKDRSLKQEAITRSEEELRIARENYTYLVRTNLQVLGHDFETQRLELQRRQLEYDRQASQARLKMPFDGQLNPSLPLAEGVLEYPVNAGQELAVARDLSTVFLRVPLSDAAWSSLPPERLTAVVMMPDGSRFEAPFSYKKLERTLQREDVAYYFQFPSDRASAAARLVGTEVSCELWLGLTQPARVVPKLTLVLHQPSAFSSRRWNEGLNQLAPGATLLAEGQTDLAIVLADETLTQTRVPVPGNSATNHALAHGR
ncbi:MAG TPA: hypothetical protein VK615_11405, partial [Candidatus Binatia bacterium]|nr:hypothetical protein [Candidatus Binatia bacterium]